MLYHIEIAWSPSVKFEKTLLSIVLWQDHCSVSRKPGEALRELFCRLLSKEQEQPEFSVHHTRLQGAELWITSLEWITPLGSEVSSRLPYIFSGYLAPLIFTSPWLDWWKAHSCSQRFGREQRAGTSRRQRYGVKENISRLDEDFLRPASGQQQLSLCSFPASVLLAIGFVAFRPM